MPGKISIHHIGGRDGSRGFPVLASGFDLDIINVLYDADPECIEQIRDRNRKFKSENYVYPICFAEHSGKIRFNINADPYTSSILPTNPEYRSFYAVEGEIDYVWGQSSKTMESHDFDALTIDRVFAAPNDEEDNGDRVTAPPPDFLSIDTQGSEYGILSGARQTLTNSILGLLLEVEFHPIYAGQKLFGDVSHLLSSSGFYFVKFTRLSEFSPHRAPLGLRGEGFQVAGDALFLKRPESIIGGGDDPAAKYFKLSKLAFFAAIFGQLEYALMLLGQREALGRVQASDLESDRSYLGFLSELHGVNVKAARKYQPTFEEKYSFSSSKDRFRPPEQQVGVDPTVRDSTLVPSRDPLAVKGGMRRLKRLLRRRFPRVVAAIRAARSFDHALLSADETDVEALFSRYGLIDQAMLIRKHRLGV